MTAAPETFWAAARDIVAECHAVLRPGGGAVWITKRYVKDGKIVDFSADWARLCQSQGFTLTRWARASLVKRWTDNTFDGPQEREKARKSFFRRLAERKGSPRIDWEDVLFLVKQGGAGQVDAVVGSPPFHGILPQHDKDFAPPHDSTG